MTIVARRIINCIVVSLVFSNALAYAQSLGLTKPAVDWLVDPSSFKATIQFDANKRDLTLENGLTRRTLRLGPNAATIDYKSLVTGEQLLRATGPEARVAFNGKEYPIGGLEGQPVQNYLKAEWIDNLHAVDGAYQFAEWREEPLAARFPWKKRPEWLSRDLPWPAPGKHVVLRFVPPSSAAASLQGKTIMEDTFTGQLNPAWKTHASGKHARSSFNNEGKSGEIYALPDSCVYAERAWPKEAASIELTCDAGDDTLSNAWGPGLAILSREGALSFVIRPHQQVYEVNGSLTEIKFDRTKPCMLRVRFVKDRAVCEASQDGKTYQLIAKVAAPNASPCPTLFELILCFLRDANA